MVSLKLHGLSLLVFFLVRFAIAETCDDEGICSTDFACLCAKCQNTTQCLVCGYQGSEPMQCASYNATFEDLTPKTAVGTYYQATWSPLEVVTHGPDNPIVPATSKNMVRSTTGSFVLQYVDGEQFIADNIGGLYSFSFACADACTETTSKAATSCTLSVTASCVLLNVTSDYGPEAYEFTETYQYTAPTKGLRKAPMTSVMWNAAAGYRNGGGFPIEYEYADCYNYTFVATTPSGKTPFLYMDDVVGNYEYEVGE